MTASYWKQIREIRAKTTPPREWLDGKLTEALARIEELEAALTEIASCHSLAPGDVVDIARVALGKP